MYEATGAPTTVRKDPNKGRDETTNELDGTVERDGIAVVNAVAAVNAEAPVVGAVDSKAVVVGDCGRVKAHGADAVPGSIQTAAAWSWRVLLIGLAVTASVYVLGMFQLIVVPVALSVLFAVLLAPVVRLLTVTLRLPKGLSVLVAVLGLLGFVTALVTIAGREIIHGFAELSNQAVSGFQQALDWLSEGPLGIDADRYGDLIDDLGAAAEKNMGMLLSGALSVTTTVGQVFAGSIIVLFCTFFFLLDGRRIWTWVVGLLPRTVREDVHQAGRRGVVTLGAYTRTQILVAFVDGTGIGVGAAILGLPLAFPLGALVFVGSFIPFGGPR